MRPRFERGYLAGKDILRARTSRILCAYKTKSSRQSRQKCIHITPLFVLDHHKMAGTV